MLLSLIVASMEKVIYGTQSDELSMSELVCGQLSTNNTPIVKGSMADTH